MNTPLGYSYLIRRYDLQALPLSQEAALTTTIKGRKIRQQGGRQLALFEPKYQPKDNLQGHLQFALRYEGVNLQVLALLFVQTGEQELTEWITNSPESRYARVACFLYEWLTEKTLPVKNPVPSQAKYVWVANETLQLVFPHGERQERFRVRNNLPGTRNFCPTVLMTKYLQEMVSTDLRRTILTILEKYDQGLLRRAVAYLYLKETQSSFEVEREKPSPQKAKRFADLLRQADTPTPLTEQRLVELQQAVIDPRFHEFTWRTQQNWLGQDLGYRQQVDFVPPRPADVPDLMTGLLVLVEEFQNQGDGSIVMSPDPVIMAAVIAFGFVFIHPFMDGNGRIHRYLIHDILAKAGFTPTGIVLPVSAVILANLDDYISTLEHFSSAVNSRTNFDPEQPDIQATGNDPVYFQFPDLTAQTEFLYRSLDRTVTEDLKQEIDFLLGFDRARKTLNDLLDWPDHSLELFIRAVRNNNYELSQNKRKSHFLWMSEEEINEAQRRVRDAFAESKAEKETE